MGTGRAFGSFFRESIRRILVGNRYYYLWVGFLLAVIAAGAWPTPASCARGWWPRTCATR
jgi:hypothetical protein